MVLTLSTFGPIDWTVLGVYLAVMVAIGAAAGRKHRDTSSYFLAGRSMPAWAVSLSILATALSAATFIGAPAESFRGDLTYLILNVGGLIAVVIVAAVFLPVFYRAGTVTVYGYLGRRFGDHAMIGASLTFLMGRLLASGARLFMAAIAFSLIIYQDTQVGHLIMAILIFGIVGTLYTCLGGIRAVIWTDVIQIVIVVGAAGLSLCLLLNAIPLSIGQILDALGDPVSQVHGHDKLTVIDTSFDLQRPFTLWTGLFAIVFFNMAAFGVDQDLVQRMLTCRSAWRGSLALIASNLIAIPVVIGFMSIGLLLFVFYGRADLMGDAAPVDVLTNPDQVYPQFLINHLPAGLSGLAMAGLLAAAMSSLDSAINAMASSVTADLYLPWRRVRGLETDDPQSLRASRCAVVAMGLLLTLFAVGTVFWYDPERDTLISFALGVMTFAYAGLLGVFLTAILTRRGNGCSALAALVAGAITVVLLQPGIAPKWLGFTLASPWWMVIATPISFLVCFAGSPRPANDRTRTAT